MLIMTEGLRAVAGRSLRAALMHYTRTPYSGAAMGAVSTAILQSSSATSVAVISFVGAELMTFSNALGVLFGANIGTTITGWLVALLGFKLKLSTLVLPFIFLGAILRLFSQSKLANAGYALAGFGLIFVGITTMQEGMSDLQTFFSFKDISESAFSGRFFLVLIGIVFTIITQSSSAGVAASLSALHSDLINFDQAAALVIGMDIGTTVTAMMATIGASTDARRTGFSHVIYNLLTGCMALLLLTPFIYALQYIHPQLISQHAEIALVLFHSSFNFIGVLLILPFTSQFARLIERLVPDKQNVTPTLLDTKLLNRPSKAIRTVQPVIQQQLIYLLKHVNWLLRKTNDNSSIDLEQTQHTLDGCHRYLDNIHLESTDKTNWPPLISLIHTMDHLQRLHERCEEEEYPKIELAQSSQLQSIRKTLVDCIPEIIDHIQQQKWLKAYKTANHARSLIHKQEKSHREHIIQEIGVGKLDVNQGSDLLASLRWLKRISVHIARICRHLQQATLFSSR